MTDAELDSQADYLNLSLELDEFEDYLVVKREDLTATNKLVDLLSKLEATEGKLPPLQCGTEKDKFAFSNFLIQFENVIGHKKSLADSAKLSYLINYLKGYALKLVNHLAVCDENYSIALKLLKDEFLDVDYVVGETYRNLLQARLPFKDDPEFRNVKEYINEVRSYLFELKHYGVDLLEEKTAGNSFVSHIIFNKLPFIFKKELSSRVQKAYPTLQDIFDNYIDIVKPVKKEASKKSEKSKSLESNKALQNFSTNGATPKSN